MQAIPLTQHITDLITMKHIISARRDFLAPDIDISEILSYLSLVAQFNISEAVDWNDSMKYYMTGITVKYPTLYHILETKAELRLFYQFCNNPIAKQRVATKLFII